MNTLHLMCGPSGAGKSYYINKTFANCKYVTIVSRDEIRFSLLQAGEDYFAHEKEVFKIFVEQIQRGLLAGDVVADATHLNEKSRNKLLDKLVLDRVEIFCYNFINPKELAKKRNQLRTGLACVPDYVIDEQYKCWAPATHNEKYMYEKIFKVVG